MLNSLKDIDRKHITFIGDNAVDMVLYISRMCSFNYKTLVIDMSSNESLLSIVSPDGSMEIHNIHYAKYNTVQCELEFSYDLIIAYSDKAQNIPQNLLCGEIYLITSIGKNYLRRIQTEIHYLSSKVDKVYVVLRGGDSSDNLKKKELLAGIAPLIKNQVVFLFDKENDSLALWKMEYNSSFLYEYLSKDFLQFLSFVFVNTYKIKDSTYVPEVTRCRWVM